MYSKHQIINNPLSTINSLILNEIIKDLNFTQPSKKEETTINKSSPHPSIILEDLKKEVEEQKKHVLETALQTKNLKENNAEIEEKLHQEILKKYKKAITAGQDAKIQSYILHVQNLEVIEYLKNSNKNISNEDSMYEPFNTNLNYGDVVKRLGEQLANLKLIIDLLENYKARTDNHVQKKLNLMETELERHTKTISNEIIELLAQAKSAKGIDYLLRNLYAEGHSALFSTDNERDLFLGAVFFSSRFKSLSKHSHKIK